MPANLAETVFLNRLAQLQREKELAEGKQRADVEQSLRIQEQQGKQLERQHKQDLETAQMQGKHARLIGKARDPLENPQLEQAASLGGMEAEHFLGQERRKAELAKEKQEREITAALGLEQYKQGQTNTRHIDDWGQTEAKLAETVRHNKAMEGIQRAYRNWQRGAASKSKVIEVLKATLQDARNFEQNFTPAQYQSMAYGLMLAGQAATDEEAAPILQQVYQQIAGGGGTLSGTTGGGYAPGGGGGMRDRARQRFKQRQQQQSGSYDPGLASEYYR